VAGRIDQVHLAAAPLQVRGGARDRDAALLLEFHVVHGRAVAVAMDLFHFMDAARVKENPLAQGRLARVDVSGNAEVAYFR
jgi:hypothetical protein